MPSCLMEKYLLNIRYEQVIAEYLDFGMCASQSNGKFTLNLCDAQVFKTKNSEISCKYMITNEYLCFEYEGESISNQPIPFPMDRDGHNFHALFQYVLYVDTKLHAYRIIL